MPTPMSQSRFLDRWRNFKAEPQQVSGASMLYDAISQGWGPDRLLIEEADWAVKFSERPPAPPPGSNPLKVPYFSQMDNSSGQGSRECFSSSVAMVAAFHGKVKTDDEWNAIRARFGDTTSSCAQLAALQSVGLTGTFRTNGNFSDLVREIDLGFPVCTGWLHHGPVSAPSGGGHWSTVVGYKADTHFIHHDPFGIPDLVGGGYIRTGGDGSNQNFSRQNWGRRWMVEGNGTGWYLAVRP